MDKFLSSLIYCADVGMKEGASASPLYSQTTAKEVGFNEEWLQNAISNDPSIVIAPCTQSGLTNERWWFWESEFEVDVGPIDVLLVSESGRVGIVETKLAYNPEGRRSVLAQLLDYAVHLGEVDAEDLPDLPAEVRLSPEDVARRIQEDRDFLLIVAGDQLNSRAVKLGRTLLGDHLLNRWELALVEVSVFKRTGTMAGPEHLLVPHIRGAIQVELRQVVRVVVEGDRSRVVVERVEPEVDDNGAIQWDEPTFLAAVEANPHMKAARALASSMSELARLHAGTHVRWGKGKTASALLKRNGRTVVEIYAGLGQVILPRGMDVLIEALGEAPARQWLEGLQRLLPDQMGKTRPTLLTRHDPPLDEVLALLKIVLAQADGASQQP